MASRSLPLPRLGPPAGASTTPPHLVAGALGTAVVVASVMAYNVKLGVVLLAAICFVPLALLQLPLAICCWAVLLFFSRVPGIHGIPDKLLLVIAACWVGVLASRRAEAREALARNQGVIVPVMLFVAWVMVSLAWAPVPASAERGIKDLLYAVLGFLLLLGTIVDRRQVRWLVAAFVVGATLSVLWGAAKGGLSGALGGVGAVTDQDGRFQAGSGDPNYLAAVLVPAIMLAGGLAYRRSALRRLGLGVAVVASAVGLAATQSRGGIVAAIVTAVVALAIWRGRRALIASLIVGAIAATAAFFAASPAAWDRIHNGNSSGSGRIDIWQVAWRVGDDHPIVGVGVYQFPEVSPRYVRQPGALDYVDLIVDKHILVHNLYLELWVETGIVGLLLFLAAVSACVAAAWRAVKLFDAQGDGEMAALARTVVLAVVGMLSASFFLSNVSNHQIWVLLALGPVMLGIARRSNDRPVASFRVSGRRRAADAPA